MKTPKIVTLILTFVLFSFLHVYLQTEIIKLGYEVKKNEDMLQEFIDDNYILKYNIYTLESPFSLDQHVLEKNSNLRALRPIQVLGLYSEPNPANIHTDINKNSLFSGPVFLALKKIFTGRQAEAKTIK